MGCAEADGTWQSPTRRAWQPSPAKELMPAP